jgi:hypothetical protein
MGILDIASIRPEAYSRIGRLALKAMVCNIFRVNVH